ncbi:MAG: KpsF/GutQ family sugar-phosphate isomerase [Bacteroidales bacterium]|nr:KpsF/GutQ family sugar-phosphate isomerase [Bacteroidales bacterium]
MKSTEEINRIALRTIREEGAAIVQLGNYINDDFARCVETIINSTGRVIVTGIGKSANIASKIVSTFNSTGTPSIFMHAADAIHGDLGMIRPEDIIICLSKSGDTPEIKVLVPLLKIMGNKLIGLVGNTDSFLARNSDLVINSTVNREACPNNLAPTASTTAQLVMGDALAVALLECRGFTREDFARYHPGGALGKRLYLRVSDIFGSNEKPEVQIDDDMRSVILEISSKRLGATAVLDGDKLAGIITDGDIRRMLHREGPVHLLKAGDIMTRDPLTLSADILVADALDVMRKNNITQILVLDNDRYVGVVHLHDILKEGII